VAEDSPSFRQIFKGKAASNLSPIPTTPSLSDTEQVVGDGRAPRRQDSEGSQTLCSLSQLFSPLSTNLSISSTVLNEILKSNDDSLTFSGLNTSCLFSESFDIPPSLPEPTIHREQPHPPEDSSERAALVTSPTKDSTSKPTSYPSTSAINREDAVGPATVSDSYLTRFVRPLCPILSSFSPARVPQQAKPNRVSFLFDRSFSAVRKSRFSSCRFHLPVQKTTSKGAPCSGSNNRRSHPAGSILLSMGGTAQREQSRQLYNQVTRAANPKGHYLEFLSQCASPHRAKPQVGSTADSADAPTLVYGLKDPDARPNGQTKKRKREADSPPKKNAKAPLVKISIPSVPQDIISGPKFTQPNVTFVNYKVYFAQDPFVEDFSITD
jgi:hypothetical protein